MDFVRDYMRALLAKRDRCRSRIAETEISGCFISSIAQAVRYIVATYCPSITEDLRGRQHKTRPPLQEAAAGGKTFSHIRL